MCEVIDKTDKSFWEGKKLSQNEEEYFGFLPGDVHDIPIEGTFYFGEELDLLISDFNNLVPEIDQDIRDVVIDFLQNAYLIGKDEGEASALHNISLFGEELDFDEDNE